jgi:hypothetical protein
VDLGAAGLVNVQIPHLSFANGGFEADGGLVEDRDRPLTLPLTPIKKYLEDKIPAVASALPDGMRVLASPKLLAGSEQVLAALPQYLEQHFAGVLPGGKVPAELADALKALAAAEEHLPIRLKEYLDADPPNDVSFLIRADASGSLTIDLQTHDATRTVSPAVALTPAERPVMALVPALPNLIGIRLSRLQLGPIFGGSLILLRLNAEIDVFDPVILAGSIAAAESETLRGWLPDAEQAHHTLIAHDLTALVAPEAPIPVPLFYEKLGVDTCGPAGLAMAASVSFDPLAENTLASVFQALLDFYKFITVADARLPLQGATKLDASIGPTFLQLPPFLGGKTFGSKDHAVAHVDLSHLFANVLNGVKFFSLPYVIAGVPLEHRCGSINPQFGPLAFDMGWAATTRQEFEAGLKWSAPTGKTSNPLMTLPKAEQTALLSLAAVAPGKNVDAGLVLLFFGHAQVGKAFAVTGRFGMVAAGRNGFATGVDLSASILDDTGVSFSGRIAFDFEKKGTSTGELTGRLLISGRTALEGELSVSAEKCRFSGHADLFPGLHALTIQGDVAASLTSTAFAATGSANVSLFGVVSTTEQFTIDHQSFRLTATFALPLFETDITFTSAHLAQHESIELTSELDNFIPMLIPKATSAARQKMTSMLNDLVKWADNGYKKEESATWLESLTTSEHTLATWELYHTTFATLRDALNTGSRIAEELREEVNAALNLLPEALADGIRFALGGGLLFGVSRVRLHANMASALLGEADLYIDLAYAGKQYTGLGPLAVSLEASNLPALVASGIVKKIFAT